MDGIKIISQFIINGKLLLYAGGFIELIITKVTSSSICGFYHSAGATNVIIFAPLTGNNININFGGHLYSYSFGFETHKLTTNLITKIILKPLVQTNNWVLTGIMEKKNLQRSYS